MGEPVDELLKQRQAQCFVKRRAFEMWLHLLTPLRWFAVSAGTLLPLVAGAKILGTPALLGSRYELVSSFCALAASAITGLHAALKCEDHQSECRRMIQEYLSLEAAYQAARALPDPQPEEKLRDLEARYEAALDGARAAAPTRFQRRAERELRRSNLAVT